MTAPQDPYGRPSDGTSGQQPGGWPGYGPGPDAPPAGSPYGAPGYGTPGGYGAPGGYGIPAQGPGYGGGPQLAEWSTRAGGYLIDFAISFVAQFVVALIDPVLAQVVGFGIFLYFGYVTGTTGQTPGRKVVGIRVLREADGQVLGPGAGIGRGFLHILDALPLLLGFFWPLWDKKKQTFADKIIQSVVVKV